ncbi:MAG: phosphotransferase [Candidatus Micrarchaeota archaeon]|nr:phosphotransferase [Candidatus Micrarchaeota archaeon]
MLRQKTPKVEGSESDIKTSSGKERYVKLVIDNMLAGDPALTGSIRYIRHEALRVLKTPGFDIAILNNGICIKVTDSVYEQDALARLHQADPEHTVRPLFCIRDPTRAGKIVAYAMEEAKGTTLHEMLVSARPMLLRAVIPQVIKQLDRAVSNYHKKGLPHNDIHEKNIMVNVEPGMRATIKLIDPMDCGKGWRTMRIMERESLHERITLLKLIWGSHAP